MFLSRSVPRTLKSTIMNQSRMLSTEPPHGIANSTEFFSARKEGELFMKENGWDCNSLVEQSVRWGDQDSFKHLNNVITIRYFETGRMAFVASLLPELSEGSEKSLVRGEGGIGVIREFLFLFYSFVHMAHTIYLLYFSCWYIS